MATQEYKTPHFKRLNVIMRADEYAELTKTAKKYRLTITQYIKAAIDNYREFLKNNSKRT